MAHESSDIRRLNIFHFAAHPEPARARDDETVSFVMFVSSTLAPSRSRILGLLAKANELHGFAFGTHRDKLADTNIRFLPSHTLCAVIQHKIQQQTDFFVGVSKAGVLCVVCVRIVSREFPMKL